MKHNEFELLEARLTLELKQYTDQPTTEPKPKRERPPRDYLVCKLSCKHSRPGAGVTIVTAEVQTISELVARLEAAKLARKLGYYPEECIELSLDKITR